MKFLCFLFSVIMRKFEFRFRIQVFVKSHNQMKSRTLLRKSFCIIQKERFIAAASKYDKCQLILERFYEVILPPKIPTKYFQDFRPGSLLLQGQNKRESIFLQQEGRLSFCINLDVAIFPDSEFSSFLEEVFDIVICFRDLLTFTYAIYCWLV